MGDEDFDWHRLPQHCKPLRPRGLVSADSHKSSMNITTANAFDSSLAFIFYPTNSLPAKKTPKMRINYKYFFLKNSEKYIVKIASDTPHTRDRSDAHQPREPE